ncbi:hypothetical protein ACUN24_24795 [Pedobacter sp. WC2501]|uniref:hypothetical protein n=1 Tax=Pedobacter sp. WC2501 TaxID=3461400 RepID=UPI004045C2C2
MEFNELYWHDSVIKRVEVDRSNPGIHDTIVFEIDWYDIGMGKLYFENVYWIRLDMNFGIVADECIDDAFKASDDDVDLARFNRKWNGLINENLACYVIKTASTGSEFKIIAGHFRVDKI